MTASRETKLKANELLGVYLEKNLTTEVSAVLGPKVDVAKVVLLSNALKISLRSKVGSKLGVAGGSAAGDIGGSAGGGSSLEAGAGLSAGVAGGVGKVGGVPSGDLSLGSGLGTRAARPGSKEGSVVFGSSSGGSFGVGAQAGFQTPASIDASMATKVQNSILSAFETSLVDAGVSPAERTAIKSEVQPAIKSAVGDSFNSAFGPELGYPHASGVILLGVEVSMPEHGPWKAVVEIDEEKEDAPIPSGPFVFDIDGVEFRGTVESDRAGAFGGRIKIRVVGGAGGLYHKILVRNYAGGLTKAKTVLDDILRDSGEALSAESDQELLNTRLEGWERTDGTAHEALTVLCKKLGAEWRVLRDGKIWIGKDTWPEVEPAGVITDSDWGDGVVSVIPEFATLVPGIIVRGQKVKQVIYVLSRKGLKASLYNKSTSELLNGIVERATKGLEYTKRYRCEIVTQNSDGTVDVKVDSDQMKGKGVGKCRVRVGVPGTRLTVPAGARCLVGWDDGDPELPYVDSWESSTPATLVEVGKGAVAVAQTGGTVQALLPPQLLITGTVTPGPPPAPAAAFVGMLTIPQPLVGVIQGGSSALKAGAAGFIEPLAIVGLFTVFSWVSIAVWYFASGR